MSTIVRWIVKEKDNQQDPGFTFDSLSDATEFKKSLNESSPGLSLVIEKETKNLLLE